MSSTLVAIGWLLAFLSCVARAEINEADREYLELMCGFDPLIKLMCCYREQTPTVECAQQREAFVLNHYRFKRICDDLGIIQITMQNCLNCPKQSDNQRAHITCMLKILSGRTDDGNALLKQNVFEEHMCWYHARIQNKCCRKVGVEKQYCLTEEIPWVMGHRNVKDACKAPRLASKLEKCKACSNMGLERDVLTCILRMLHENAS